MTLLTSAKVIHLMSIEQKLEAGSFYLLNWFPGYANMIKGPINTDQYANLNLAGKSI